MPIMIDKKRTEAYIGTFDTTSAADMLELEELSKMVMNLNKDLKRARARDRSGNALRYRLTKKGRGAIDKKVINGKEISYDAFGHIVGGLGNASRIDAYIHRRYDRCDFSS